MELSVYVPVATFGMYPLNNAHSAISPVELSQEPIASAHLVTISLGRLAYLALPIASTPPLPINVYVIQAIFPKTANALLLRPVPQDHNTTPPPNNANATLLDTVSLTVNVLPALLIQPGMVVLVCAILGIIYLMGFV